MRRTEALQGVRVIKFRSVLDRYETSELNQIEAENCFASPNGHFGVGVFATMRPGTLDCWTAVWAGYRANASRWIANTR